MSGLLAVPMLNQDTFGIVFDALKQGEPQFSHDGDAFRLGLILGKGGTKSVYDTEIVSEHIALALPNIADDAIRGAIKWQKVLREPSATNTVRELGFMVNTRCEVMPISVDGTLFPAIALTRYADLSVEVRDHKNPNSSVVKGDIFTTTPTIGSFIDVTHGLARDTAALVERGVLLGSDSFNLGRDDDGLHLFLNDLASAEFEKLNEKDAADYAVGASMAAVNALLSGLTWGEYNRHRDFFDSDAFHFRNGQAYRQFTDIVLAEAGISS